MKTTNHFVYRMPPDASMLCRYGLPFRAGTNPVSRYFAGVGSEAGKTDIVAYEEVSYLKGLFTFGGLKTQCPEIYIKLKHFEENVGRKLTLKKYLR